MQYDFAFINVCQLTLLTCLYMYRNNLEGNTKMLKMAKPGDKDWWDSFIVICFFVFPWSLYF